jgi:hypothetical protein
LTRKQIQTNAAVVSCDVCGRTLLRGEHAEIYLDGSARRSVCDLCVPRALHEGWLREGTVPEYGGKDQGAERRRSLFARWRSRRAAAPEPEDATVAEKPLAAPWTELPIAKKVRERVREPRHVRAIPTSPEHRVASAIEVFNGSLHPRTVAGVARSLGAPTVAVLPVDARPSLVNVTVSWELCWYRYEVDLSEEMPEVRQVGQGYELDELPAQERRANAVCDEHGALMFAA